MKTITLSDAQFNFLASTVRQGGFFPLAQRDLANTVYEVFHPTPPKPKTLSFQDVRILAEKAGENAVDTFLATHPEPMYCGTAYLYRKIALPLKSRQRKIRYEEDKIRCTGFARSSQSLDLQEMWCKAATKVFNDHGIDILERSWVD